jgi:hypothetical protein
MYRRRFDQIVIEDFSIIVATPTATAASTSNQQDE